MSLLLAAYHACAAARGHDDHPGFVLMPRPEFMELSEATMAEFFGTKVVRLPEGETVLPEDRLTRRFSMVADAIKGRSG